MKFVQLMGTNVKKGRPELIVPTYQIDLMWHTHILSSIQLYHEDCIRMNGCILNHDDSLTDRSDGGVLDRNFKATCRMWKEVYGIEYKVHGGMYRGKSGALSFISIVLVEVWTLLVQI